jgi:predicted nucleic-acid-binding Zn-ribbon protein
MDAAITWLHQKWTQNCPYCGNHEWRVSTPFELSRTDGKALSPHFAVMCTNCGQTAFINAIVAGIVPDTTRDE